MISRRPLIILSSATMALMLTGCASADHYYDEFFGTPGLSDTRSQIEQINADSGFLSDTATPLKDAYLGEYRQIAMPPTWHSHPRFFLYSEETKERTPSDSATVFEGFTEKSVWDLANRALPIIIDGPHSTYAFHLLSDPTADVVTPAIEQLRAIHPDVNETLEHAYRTFSGMRHSQDRLGSVLEAANSAKADQALRKLFSTRAYDDADLSLGFAGPYLRIQGNPHLAQLGKDSQRIAIDSIDEVRVTRYPRSERDKAHQHPYEDHDANVPWLRVNVDYTYRLPFLTDRDGRQRVQLSAPLRATTFLTFVPNRDGQAVVTHAGTEIDTYIYPGDTLKDWQQWESERAEKNLETLTLPFPDEQTAS